MRIFQPAICFLSLLLVAAAPAHKRDKPFKDLNGIIAAIPAEIRPSKGDPWTNTNTELANDWFKKNLAGKEVQFTYILSSATASDGSGSVRLAADDFKEAGLNIHVPRIQARLADGEKAKLAKLKPKDLIAVKATIERVEINMYKATRKKDTATMLVILSGAAIQKK